MLLSWHAALLYLTGLVSGGVALGLVETELRQLTNDRIALAVTFFLFLAGFLLWARRLYQHAFVQGQRAAAAYFELTLRSRYATCDPEQVQETIER